MDDVSTDGWPRLLALVAGGIVIFATVYYAALWRERPEGFSSDPNREKIVLRRGEAKVLERGKIIYKGLGRDGTFRMGAVIFDLDPEYVYAYAFPVESGENGFRLVGERFVLISAGTSKIRLWRLRDAPAVAVAGDGPPPLNVAHLGPKNIFGP
jgi:hypothetical protein